MKKRITLTLDEDLLKIINENAKKQNRSVSNYLDQLLKTKLIKKENKNEIH